MQIAALTLLGLDIVFQLLPDGVAVGQEHGQAAADQVVGHEQAHFLADLAVVALASLLLLLLPGVQLLLIAESYAVDTGQHLVLFVVLPVSAGLLGDLEGFQGLGVGQVGSDAHVHVLALLVEAELGLLGQVSHMLDLVVLLAIFHQLDGFGAGQNEGLDGKILFADLLHLFLDGGQVLVGQLGVAEVDVVVEAVLGGGAEGKVSLGVQALDGLGHDMGSGVAQDMQLLVLRALGDGTVFVDDLHDCTLLLQLHKNAIKNAPSLAYKRDEACSSTVPPRLRFSI